MAVAEVKADDLFVGFDHAETRLSDEWVTAAEAASRLAVTLLLIAAQIAWVVAFGYFAFMFLAS